MGGSFLNARSRTASITKGDFQPDCSADQPVAAASPSQPTANPKAQALNRKASCCVATGN
eukprot:1162013-Pelagomonas_calceolata.AAC.8